MKIGWYGILIFILFLQCEKSSIEKSKNDFVLYTIKAGEQYSDNNSIKILDTITEMKFVVKFDSSAIYSTINPINQYDVNKLYGFSDNNTFHHINSARIGWCWLHNELQLYGYIYNDSIRTFQYITSIPINAEISCSIKIDGNAYLFRVQDTSIVMPRISTIAKGYQLFPYFGGDEVAPHDIRIWIKNIL